MWTEQHPVQQTSAKLRFAGFVPWQRRPVSGDEQLAWSVTPSATAHQLGHFVALPEPDRPPCATDSLWMAPLRDSALLGFESWRRSRSTRGPNGVPRSEVP
jgi:hypothetical protein